VGSNLTNKFPFILCSPHIAQAIMVQVFGYKLAVLTLCETRWNSMQECFASLLRMHSAFKIFTVQYCNDLEFPEELKVFGNQYFWPSIASADQTICPLSNACYKLQRNENTLADVVLCYKDIHEGFCLSDQHDELVPLIENCWAECKQPLFTLGYFLNPYTVDEGRKLPDTRISSIDKICDFVVYYHC
jgi:hypothetical protein